MPPLGIAPRLSAPQAEVLLLYYSGSVEVPGIDPGSQPCEGCMLPSTTYPHWRASAGTRTRILCLEGTNTTLVLRTQYNGPPAHEQQHTVDIF